MYLTRAFETIKASEEISPAERPGELEIGDYTETSVSSGLLSRLQAIVSKGQSFAEQGITVNRNPNIPDAPPTPPGGPDLPKGPPAPPTPTDEPPPKPMDDPPPEAEPKPPYTVACER